MKKNNLSEIILKSCISEKASRVKADRQYVFRVRPKATKAEIAAAVKLLFGVDVEVVRVCNCQGKTRRVGNIQGKRQDWKKAYVTLSEGQVIDLGGV